MEHFRQFLNNEIYKEAIARAEKCKTIADLTENMQALDMSTYTASDIVVSPIETTVPNPIMIIGKSPGETELKLRKPFCGPAGEILQQAFKMAGENMNDYHQTYATRWRPRKNNTPTKTQLAISSPFLIREIEIIKPRKLIVLGAYSADILLGTHSDMKEDTESETIWRDIKLVNIRNNGFILRHRQLLPEYAQIIKRHGYQPDKR